MEVAHALAASSAFHEEAEISWAADVKNPTAALGSLEDSGHDRCHCNDAKVGRGAPSQT